MRKAQLDPTPDQTFEVIGEGPCDFVRVLARSRGMQRAGDVRGACNERFQAVRRLAELIPEDEEVILEWNHANSRAALETIRASAVDHFLIDDFELSAALLEMLLDLDPEDHLQGSELLAFVYVAMDERELFDETIDGMPESPARELLLLWSGYRRDGRLPEEALERFRGRFAPYYAEFAAAEHPVDESYLREIAGERPSQRALARELWLRTENLWARWPEFVAALRGA